MARASQARGSVSLIFILLYLEAARFPLLLRWGLGTVGGEQKRAEPPLGFGSPQEEKGADGQAPHRQS